MKYIGVFGLMFKGTNVKLRLRTCFPMVNNCNYCSVNMVLNMLWQLFFTYHFLCDRDDALPSQLLPKVDRIFQSLPTSF